MKLHVFQRLVVGGLVEKYFFFICHSLALVTPNQMHVQHDVHTEGLRDLQKKIAALPNKYFTKNSRLPLLLSFHTSQSLAAANVPLLFSHGVGVGIVFVSVLVWICSSSKMIMGGVPFTVSKWLLSLLESVEKDLVVASNFQWILHSNGCFQLQFVWTVINCIRQHTMGLVRGDKQSRGILGNGQSTATF